MVGPSGRRRAVAYLMSLSKYSERRACRLLGQSRSTQRYKVRPTSDRDQRLRARVIELARQHPRYGYRRLTHELRRGSWKVNRKCVRRICREEGLKIVRRAKKRRRLGQSKNGVMKLRAERKNHVWSYDFVFDQLENGRAIKILPIVDNFTRECLHIETAHHITGERIVEILKELIARSARRPSFAPTTGRSSSRGQYATGWPRRTAKRRSSSLAARGKMPIVSRSTAASATSCSTARSLPLCSKRGP